MGIRRREKAHLKSPRKNDKWLGKEKRDSDC